MPNKYDHIPPFGTKEYEEIVRKGSTVPEDFDYFHDNLALELGDVRDIAIENPLDGPEWHEESAVTKLLVQFIVTNDSIYLVSKYILGVTLPPYQVLVLRKFWEKPLCLLVATRGGSKSFLLAVYAILRLLLHQGCKICVVGASLRQSLVLFNYIMQIWNSAPILRDIVKDSPKRDINMSYWQVGLSRVIFLPLGDGETIRGQRATHIICDETASINPVIFEKVVRGFAAVKSDGVWNNIQKAYSQELLNSRVDIAVQEDLGLPNILESNQIIMAGSAVPEFNHFYKYYRYYRDIIDTKGNAKLLKEMHPDRDITEDIDPKDYCVMHIPHDALPPGMMDKVILKQGQATMDKNIFMMEYGACFVKDTDGFIPASTIYRATCPMVVGDDKIIFDIELYGDKEARYVMGIDPASEDDNFAVSVVGMKNGRRCIVYQWTTNRKEFEQLRSTGQVRESITDYLTFCTLHVRNLVRRFNPVMIGLDTGGGGLAFKEALKDKSKFIDSNDVFILDMDDENSHELSGDTILKMIEFSHYQWRREAHYGIKTDINNGILLFPRYDLAEGAVKSFENLAMGRFYDTLEDANYEIEQCKQECVRIKAEQTPSGLEKWDVPSVMTAGANGEKVKLKKDRFTSLMIANWVARLAAEHFNIEQEKATALPFVGGLLQNYSQEAVPAESGYMMEYAGRGANRIKNMVTNGRYLKNRSLGV